MENNLESKQQTDQESIPRRAFFKAFFKNKLALDFFLETAKKGKTDAKNLHTLSRRQFIQDVSLALVGLMVVAEGRPSTERNFSPQELDTNLRKIEERIDTIVESYQSWTEEGVLKVTGCLFDLSNLINRVDKNTRDQYRYKIQDIAAKSFGLVRCDHNEWGLPLPYNKENIKLKQFIFLKDLLSFKYTNASYDQEGNLLKNKEDKQALNILYLGQIHGDYHDKETNTSQKIIYQAIERLVP